MNAETVSDSSDVSPVTIQEERLPLWRALHSDHSVPETNGHQHNLSAKHSRQSSTSTDGKKSNALKASGNLFIAVVGAGVLGLPFAFKQSGLAVGATMLVVVASIALYCMLLLVRCKRHLEEHGVVSYGEVTRHTLGPTGQRLVDTLLIISQTGFCVAYLIFIKANVSSLAPIPGDLALCVTLVPLVALAQLRGVAALGTFSLVADVAMLTGFAVVLFDDVVALSHFRPPIVAATGWSCLPYLFGVAIYCFEGVGMILPIEASMETPRQFDMVLCGTMAAVTALYVAFGSVGYIAFGQQTQDIITFNLSPGISTPAVKGALCIGLFLTFPPMMIPVYQVIERGLARRGSFLARFPEEGQQWMVFRSIRTALVFVATLIAMFVPGFGSFISLIGSLACALLAFVIPTICYLKIFGDSLNRWQYGANCAVIGLGIVGAIAGTLDACRKLLSSS